MSGCVVGRIVKLFCCHICHTHAAATGVWREGAHCNKTETRSSGKQNIANYANRLAGGGMCQRIKHFVVYLYFNWLERKKKKMQIGRIELYNPRWQTAVRYTSVKNLTATAAAAVARVDPACLLSAIERERERTHWIWQQIYLYARCKLAAKRKQLLSDRRAQIAARTAKNSGFYFVLMRMGPSFRYTLSLSRTESRVRIIAFKCAQCS